MIEANTVGDTVYRSAKLMQSLPRHLAITLDAVLGNEKDMPASDLPAKQ